tara:strand:+ start:451 stop:588 length:138 start_codon:yes stop_codon:yes gene_type:complete
MNLQAEVMTKGRWARHRTLAGDDRNKIDNIFNYREPSENEARATT